VGNALYYKRIERKWQMLDRYSNSPAFTETENDMTNLMFIGPCIIVIVEE
jgi:hypothetical protein